jgi:DNA modification methylase
VSAEEFPEYTLRWLDLVQPLLTPTGCIALIVGTQIQDFHVQPWFYRTMLALYEAGWYERFNPIWTKPDAAPLGARELPRRSWEYVLVLTRNPKAAYLDPYGNGRPSKRIGPVEGPAWSWSKQGSTKGCHEGMARGTDLFRVGVAANAENDLGKGHPARFPARLAQQVIRVLSQPNDLVLDPFAGTGSTAVAAIREGRRSLGIEIMPKYAEMARAWIARESDCGA